MEWLLIVLHFTGPTSPDAIRVKRFDTQSECLKQGERVSPYDPSSYVCFPVAALPKENK